MSREAGADQGDEATLEMTPAEMRRFGRAVVESIITHLSTLREKRVVSVASREDVEALFRAPPPEAGRPLDEVLGDFREKIAPRMTHVDHPRTFAFVPGAGTFVGAMGDALAAGYNIYAGTWVEASAATGLELVVTDWFRSWLGMPESAGGTLVSGGSVANLTGLVLAREQRLGDAWADGVIYTSELAHSSVRRGARILGFRGDQVRAIRTDGDGRLDVAALGDVSKQDERAGHRPFCLVANGGTTNTGSVDPLSELAELASERGLWLHVDAAYGGFAALDPRGRELLRGIERADSVALDPHKWLYTPFEAGCILVREFELLREAFHVLPEYLVDLAGAPEQPNMCDYGVQLSRSTRALKIWMSVQAFGLARYRAVISRTLDLARHAEARLRELPSLEVTSPATLGVVTFRYVPTDARSAEGGVDEERVESVNREIVKRVWAGGRAMIHTTRLRGRLVLRMCVINHTTLQRDVDEVLDLVAALGAEISTGPDA